MSEAGRLLISWPQVRALLRPPRKLDLGTGVPEAGHQDNDSAPRSQGGLPTKALARLLSHIDTSGGPDACHPWMGRLDRDGYGVHGRGTRVNRTICEAAHGPPPFKGAEAAHSCDNRPCSNPGHLAWETHAQNVRDQIDRGRHRNCQPYGKPYSCGTCGAKGHNARTCATSSVSL